MTLFSGKKIKIARQKATAEFNAGTKYCPIISRNTIIKNSTSLENIWQTIHLHFGFQSTGGHFINFLSIALENDERPVDLYHRLMAFKITHQGYNMTVNDEMTSSLGNFVVLTHG